MDNLTGLVVCGGQSCRMGMDKSMLDYYGKPHSFYLFHILQDFCNAVYLSINRHQSINADSAYPFITDGIVYSDIGPMSALLSAWQKFPDASLLTIGCDYPFVNKETIKTLIRNREANATCFVHPERNIYEPLLTIYESSFYPIVMKNYLAQKYSLSKILKFENVNTVLPVSPKWLQNVNTSDEYLSAKKLINQKIR